MFVQIFERWLANVLLRCRRSGGGYEIDIGKLTPLGLEMVTAVISIEAARTLAHTTMLIRSRARVAAHTKAEMKPGPLYHRVLPTTDGTTVDIEIGVTGDDALYLEVDRYRVRLDSEAPDLQFLLDRLAGDASDVGKASEPRPRPYSPGRDYVSKWFPYSN